MKKFRRIICFAAVALSLVLSSTPVFAADIVTDAKSHWIIGDEYGGAVGWNDDGSFTVYGSSGIVTYTGAKFYDEEITIRFKASIHDGWAAIYLRNNIDASLLSSKDDGGGIRAFPWYGKGQPFSINVEQDRLSLSQCYADELSPCGLGISNIDSGNNPSDGEEHTLTFRCYDETETVTTIIAYLDGEYAFDYSYTYDSVHEPKKEAGYLSFACYNSGDWLQILSVEVPDGIIEFTEDTVTTTTESDATGEKADTDDDEAVDYSAEYVRNNTSSKKKSSSTTMPVWLCCLLCFAAVLDISVVATVIVMKLKAKKKNGLVDNSILKDASDGGNSKEL